MILHLLTLSTVFAAETFKADVKDIDGKEKLFDYVVERTLTKDTMEVKSKYTDLNGEVVGEETATVTNGTLVKYEASRPVNKEKGTIEVRDGKIYFTYVEKGNKSTAKEPLEGDTLVGCTLVPWLEARMDKLVNKEELKFRYAVWFRKETVGFKFTLENDNGKEIVAKMNPTNLLYRSMVNPLYFTFEKKTKRLLQIKGRTFPKIKKDGAWKDLDALSVYKYDN